HLFAWASAENIDFNCEKKGILHIYRDKSSFEHAARVTAILARGGLERFAVSPQEIKSIEPTLCGNYYGGFYTPSDCTGDIHKFTNGLAEAIARRGVTTLFEREVTGIKATDRLVRVKSRSGSGDTDDVFDAIVVCAGTASRRIAAGLGDRLNIYPVKGYSITVNLLDELSQRAAPHVSLLDDETKLVTSRLGVDRCRVAGTAEFNGSNRDVRAYRIKHMVKWVQYFLPDACTRAAVPWGCLGPV